MDLQSNEVYHSLGPFIRQFKYFFDDIKQEECFPCSIKGPRIRKCLGNLAVKFTFHQSRAK